MATSEPQKYVTPVFQYSKKTMACIMWKGVNKHTFGRVTHSILPILEHSVKSSVQVVAIKQQWQSNDLHFRIFDNLRVRVRM